MAEPVPKRRPKPTDEDPLDDEQEMASEPQPDAEDELAETKALITRPPERKKHVQTRVEAHDLVDQIVPDGDPAQRELLRRLVAYGDGAMAAVEEANDSRDTAIAEKNRLARKVARLEERLRTATVALEAEKKVSRVREMVIGLGLTVGGTGLGFLFAGTIGIGVGLVVVAAAVVVGTHQATKRSAAPPESGEERK